ncbi:ORF6C domain-containing protein [Staphylococcus argenteus]|uniref:ORF6C domain-containing protein n=1 Tax=Staphylococcus argenteus TaxID=985002 RepID=UPI00091A5260|nr:ORF6C domain-containing protein [Staphylococcus argenteus]HCX3178750.1 ORF6C domain-containing protein [Staphylococcus aureus]MDR7639423.1 BRO family protein [Staphylococcus argenteus]SGW68140.1 prophage L54a, antirepressor [Staphylococcus argenteus]SGX19508.1 prophage L54a, antirepressor [Staphylococcus argenteus]SGX24067.1 prophage L54a, antirepressor [Staphylococcus argenteus]
MQELQTFNFEELPVRKIEVEGEPFFLGKDIAEILGYARADNAIRNHVDIEDRLMHQISASGQNRNMIIINESGLYSLIFDASKQSKNESIRETARKFKRWVTSEVLPTLRKTGTYQTKPLTTSEQIQLIAQGNTELDERVTKIEETYPIMHGEAKHIQRLVAQKVAEIVRNKFNGYYDQVSRKLFAEIYKSIKNIFDVPSYNCIPRGRYQEAIKFVERWQPSYETTYQLEMKLTE